MRDPAAWSAYLRAHVMRILARKFCTRVPVPADPELPWRSRREQSSPIAAVRRGRVFSQARRLDA